MYGASFVFRERWTHIFLSVMWLPHGQLWSIIERTASPNVKHSVIQFQLEGHHEPPKPCPTTSEVWAGNIPILSQRLNPLGHSPQKLVYKNVLKNSKVKSLCTAPFSHSLQPKLADNRIFPLYNFDMMINLIAVFQQLIKEELIQHGSLKHFRTKSLIPVTLAYDVQFLIYLDIRGRKLWQFLNELYKTIA